MPNREANPYLKERRVYKGEAPYAVYRSNVLAGWEWRVLKLWQTPSKTVSEPLARAFCQVVSPYAEDMGDTYVREIGEVFVSGEDVLAGVPRVTTGAPAPLAKYGF